MPSEYSNLSDLVMSYGVSHSELISEVHSTILQAYKEKYPKAPIDSSVVVDETTGAVHIFSQGKEITPKEFSSEAASIARQVLITKLANLQKPSTTFSTSKTESTKEKISSMTPKVSLGRIPRFIANLIFWAYNTLLSIVFGINLLSNIVNQSIKEWVEQPILAIFSSVSLAILPVASIIYAFLHKWYRSGSKLAKLFFLIEIPLILLLTIIGGISGGPKIYYFFGIILLSFPFIIYGAELQDSKNSQQNFLLFKLILTAATTTIATYLIFLYSFFTPAYVLGLPKEMFTSLNFGFGSQINPFSFLMQMTMILVIVGLLLLINFFPYGIVYVIYRYLNRIYNQATEKINVETTQTTVIATMVMTILISFGLSYQPNYDRIIDTLNQVPKETSFDEKARLVADLKKYESDLEELIKTGRSGRYSYIFTKDSSPVSTTYWNLFGTTGSVGQALDKTFLLLAYPFVYQGPIVDYNTTKAYDYVFGNYNFSTPNEANKKVFISQRSVAANSLENGIYAEVNVDETYKNTGNAQEEIIYDFSLPNGSVITDLKLGPDLEHQGQVAPRGAAQTTYQNQLQQRRDPALLEQIGPRQYRLRVFPIPGDNDRNTLDGKPQRVSFTYLTPLTDRGYGLPVYTNRSNVKTFNNSQYTFDGNTISPNSEESFLANNSAVEKLCQTQFNQTISGNKISAQLSTALTCAASNSEIEAPQISNKNIAILLDVSQVSAAQANSDQITPAKTLDSLLQPNHLNQVITNNTVDLYFFNELVSQKYNLTSNNLSTIEIPTTFGTSEVRKALQKVGSAYDLVLIITDNRQAFSQDNPLINYDDVKVHYLFPSGKLPYTKQVLTESLFVKQYAFVDSLTESLYFYDYAINQSNSTYFGGPLAFNYNITDAGSSLEEEFSRDLYGDWGSLDKNSSLTPVAALGFTFHQWNQLPTSFVSENFKDDMHSFSENQSIVSLYSSMIALVNDTQQRQLDSLSQSNNRYEEGRVIQNQSISIQRRGNVGLSSPSIPIVDSFFGVNSDSFEVGSSVGTSSSLGAGQTLSSSAGMAGVSSFNSSSLTSLFFMFNFVILIIGAIGYMAYSKFKKKKTK